MSSDFDPAVAPNAPVRQEGWWRGATFYQVYPRSFKDTNGNGLGDLQGVLSELSYIQRLGVDALWICPFFPSPQHDFGYDVACYDNVDPVFGTLDDVDAILQHAKALNLKVILDLVCGHTSTHHAWFLESRQDRHSAKAVWYVWADASDDGTPPNNWLSVFGGAAWTWEPRRRQYYLHHFLSEQPALNLHNAQVQQALLQAAHFWLQRGVSGFRLDAIDFLAHDPLLRSNPARKPPPGTVPVKPFALQEHIHDMMHPDGAVFLQALRRVIDQYPHAVLLGELSSQPGAAERIARMTGPGAPLHMAYSLAPAKQDFHRDMVLRLLRDAQDPTGWCCWSFSNHDVERVASRWGASDPRLAKLAMALLLTVRGSVCIYQGEELSLPEASLQYEDLQDPFGKRYWPEFAGRDGARTPMPWDHTKLHAGFSTNTPWLPVPASHQGLSVDLQEQDAGSSLHQWRALLNVRRQHPALQKGSLRMLDLNAPLAGMVREHNGQKIMCLMNISAHPHQVDLQDIKAQTLWTSDAASTLHTLGPWGCIVLELS